MHSARAIATRCCWPPESWPGYFFACSGILTRVRYFIASSSASFFGILRTQIGASVRFSRMVRCGNRLKCWNTMPTSRADFVDLLQVVGELDAVDDDLALLVFLEPVDAADQRRLARARRPADDDALALAPTG